MLRALQTSQFSQKLYEIGAIISPLIVEKDEIENQDIYWS